MDGATLMTVLRVGTMLVFIAVFVAIAVWLLRPSSRTRTEEQARMILDDEPARVGPRDEPAPNFRRGASRDDHPESRA